MLTVALATIIAASLISQVGLAADVVVGRNELAQARWLARGAIDWARNILAEDARTTAVDHLGEPWAMVVPPMAVDNGEVAGEIQDLDRRFNLNAVLSGSEADPKAMLAYHRLLLNLGFSPAEAAQLAMSLADWLDADDADRHSGGSEIGRYAALSVPLRPANGRLSGVGELHRLQGYSAAVIARLSPYVAVLPDRGTININTASAEVLSAVLPDLDVDAARQLVARRESTWFRNLADFDSLLATPSSSAALVPLAVLSRYFQVGGRVRFGDAVVHSESLLYRDGRWPAVLSTLWL